VVDGLDNGYQLWMLETMTSGIILSYYGIVVNIMLSISMAYVY